MLVHYIDHGVLLVADWLAIVGLGVVLGLSVCALLGFI